MGFGTLFIGYFFLINPSYFQYTDVIGASVMLLGLYKLSAYNRSFLRAAIISLIFFVLSVAELITVALDMIFSVSAASAIVSYISAPRYLVILVLTVFILIGIRDIAKEVDADELSEKSARSLPLSAIFALTALLQIPYNGELSEVAATVMGWCALTVLLATVVYVANVLITIYRAYAQICVPSQLHKSVKDGGGFMDKYWARLESGAKSYAEYKQSKKTSKKGKKK